MKAFCTEARGGSTWSRAELRGHAASSSARRPARARGPWLERYFLAFGGTISAGSSEIQRNIIAEKVLGLPRG